MERNLGVLQRYRVQLSNNIFDTQKKMVRKSQLPEVSQSNMINIWHFLMGKEGWWPVIVVGAALMIRLGFIIFSELRESVVVKYNDIDYYVFTDAARFVTEWKSPYERATYRYTPLVAYLCVGNVLIHFAFAKLVFTAFDSLLGLELMVLLRQRKLSWWWSLVWLFNPFSVIMTSRGSAESIITFLVVSAVYLLHQRKIVAGAIMYGLSVHMKIYPVLYAIPLFFFLDIDYDPSSRPIIDYFANGIVGKGSQLPTKEGELRKGRKRRINPLIVRAFTFLTDIRLKFFLYSISTFFFFTILTFVLYGYHSIYETYLYHLVRTDNRHNYSVYFYYLYLQYGKPQGFLIGLLTFLPQFILLIMIGRRYYKDIHFCIFAQTFIFVMFNKVCTSQYFMWFICIFPVVLPFSRVSLKELVLLLAAWILAQVYWLFSAYRLEFLGENTFLQVWHASLFFFIVNVCIIMEFIRGHQQQNCFYRGSITTFAKDPRKL